MNACLTSLPPTCSVCALSLKCSNLKTWHVCFWTSFFNVDPLYGFVRKLGTDGYRIPSNHQNSPSSGHFMAITWYNMVWVRDKQKKHAITQELKKHGIPYFQTNQCQSIIDFGGGAIKQPDSPTVRVWLIGPGLPVNGLSWVINTQSTEKPKQSKCKDQANKHRKHNKIKQSLMNSNGTKFGLIQIHAGLSPSLWKPLQKHPTLPWVKEN